MKAGKFAVSVQYGGGFHYFTSYPESISEAMAIKFRMQNALTHTRNGRPPRQRGAVPKVHVWQRVYDD